ncbi:MAG: hypothetical protein ACM3O6_07790, partial [Acidobacteriota bacterium]
MADLRETVPEIPVVDVADMPSVELIRRDPVGARELIRDALSWRSHPLLPLAIGVADRVSRAWLTRQGNPYFDEIDGVADLLGRPGAYFLNVVYEWACSTSVAPDPADDGVRMLRVLDWGLAGIGRHVVIARRETPAGVFYNPTWPGYAGVITGMAPGRFAAAINQAPRVPVLGISGIDDGITRLRMLAACGRVPASHLLRRVFESAPDYDAAVAQLSNGDADLAVPALFTLAGTERDQGCVIEAFRGMRRIHRLPTGNPAAIGVANQWLSRDLKGRARNHSRTTRAPLGPEENNAERRRTICAIQTRGFRGAADLPEPVLNSHTKMVIATNPRRGEMI